MTERAQKIVEATLPYTLRPKQGDRQKVIAAAIREIANCFEWDMTADDLIEIAEEVEAL